MFDEKSYGVKMDKAIDVFSKELSSLRTGRANAAMLDLVKVDVYGIQSALEMARDQGLDLVEISPKADKTSHASVGEHDMLIFLVIAAIHFSKNFMLYKSIFC